MPVKRFLMFVAIVLFITFLIICGIDMHATA